MIGVVGAGAFGTALAIALGRNGREVRLWARNQGHVQDMNLHRRNASRLPDAVLPDSVRVTATLTELFGAEAILLSVPMQTLGGFLESNAQTLSGSPMIACCKGVDVTTLKGATALIGQYCPDATAAILTGPSFAADIAIGLPTALTLACVANEGERLQHLLSTQSLRIYRTTDVVGAELGGALKNVIAIAAGVVIGAGLGDSARASLMTRGYSEMQRFALKLGARAETLAGLSGFGDLVLTCTSMQSRNLRYGIAIGAGTEFGTATTVEGVSTAQAIVRMAATLSVEMPITAMVAALVDRNVTLEQAIRSLMSRPLKQE
jgi:glycerol-3-phosphate dehydrogenase (NAD(P)+)